MAHWLTTENLVMPDHNLLQRFLHVCNFSGFHHLGVAKRVQGNRELLRCLLGEKTLISRWAWIPVYGFAVSAFFQEAEYVQSIVHNRTPTQNALCGMFLQILIGKSSKRLLHLQRANRKLVSLMHRHKKIFHNVAFMEIWLEDHEVFFEDLKNALFISVPGESTNIWTGNNYLEVLLKFDSCQQFEFFDMDRGAG